MIDSSTPSQATDPPSRLPPRATIRTLVVVGIHTLLALKINIAFTRTNVTPVFAVGTKNLPLRGAQEQRPMLSGRRGSLHLGEMWSPSQGFSFSEKYAFGGFISKNRRGDEADDTRLWEKGKNKEEASQNLHHMMTLQAMARGLWQTDTDTPNRDTKRETLCAPAKPPGKAMLISRSFEAVQMLQDAANFLRPMFAEDKQFRPLFRPLGVSRDTKTQTAYFVLQQWFDCKLVHTAHMIRVGFIVPDGAKSHVWTKKWSEAVINLARIGALRVLLHRGMGDMHLAKGDIKGFECVPEGDLAGVSPLFAVLTRFVERENSVESGFAEMCAAMVDNFVVARETYKKEYNLRIRVKNIESSVQRLLMDVVDYSDLDEFHCRQSTLINTKTAIENRMMNSLDDMTVFVSHIGGEANEEQLMATQEKLTLLGALGHLALHERDFQEYRIFETD